MCYCLAKPTLTIVTVFAALSFIVGITGCSDNDQSSRSTLPQQQQQTQSAADVKFNKPLDTFKPLRDPDER